MQAPAWSQEQPQRGSFEEALAAVEKLIPAALAVLAALLATLMFWKARSAGSNREGRAAKKEPRRFNRAEVARHNKESDLWIILKEKVYDVTSYVEEHPGGSAILRHAGQDSTKGFYGPQHPERVFDLIDDFYLGELENE